MWHLMQAAEAHKAGEGQMTAGEVQATNALQLNYNKSNN